LNGSLARYGKSYAEESVVAAFGGFDVIVVSFNFQVHRSKAFGVCRFEVNFFPCRLLHLRDGPSFMVAWHRTLVIGRNLDRMGLHMLCTWIGYAFTSR
jgi:hypothetical protein